jgi:drug/metabolite transporter (DMT)-like permease
MNTRSPDRSVLLPFLLAVLLAGNNAIAVKFSNAELPPFFGAAIRFFIAALILFGLMRIMHLKLPRRRDLQGAIIYGILGTGVNYALVYWALEYIPAGLSMILLALTPLLTFIFAWAHKQETFQWKALVGALLALGGISLIASNQISSNAPLLPILAVVLAAACFAESTVLIKTYPGAHPISTNAVAILTGSLLLFALSAISKEVPVLPSLPATWLSLLYLILLGTVAVFTLNLYVVKHWTASASSYLFVLMPIVTVLVAAWLANEAITTPFVIGGAFVLSGAYIGGIANPHQWKCYLLGLYSRLLPATPGCE